MFRRRDLLLSALAFAVSAAAPAAARPRGGTARRWPASPRAQEGDWSTVYRDEGAPTARSAPPSKAAASAPQPEAGQATPPQTDAGEATPPPPPEREAAAPSPLAPRAPQGVEEGRIYYAASPGRAGCPHRCRRWHGCGRPDRLGELAVAGGRDLAQFDVAAAQGGLGRSIHRTCWRAFKAPGATPASPRLDLALSGRGRSGLDPRLGRRAAPAGSPSSSWDRPRDPAGCHRGRSSNARRRSTTRERDASSRRWGGSSTRPDDRRRRRSGPR